jgi:hypothetical protein
VNEHQNMKETLKIPNFVLGKVLPICDLSYLRVWDKEDNGLKPDMGKIKLIETLSQIEAECGTSVIITTKRWRKENWDSVPAVRPFRKTNSKRTEGVSQVVENLLSKCKDKILTPNTAKKKNWTFSVQVIVFLLQELEKRLDQKELT